MRDVHDVPVGSRVMVRPGDRVPLDGTIVRGETSINEASITGEAVPAEKSPGSTAFAGTINEEGAIEVVTTRAAEDTTLARIIRLVSDAQRKRSPSEQWVETFARYYTPAVMLLAAAIMNDAPAMARASLGIAMGAAGTDAALETADIALMSDDLSRLSWLIHHARRTLSIIHQNITVSLAVKAVFVVLAFAGLATLWLAIVADMDISLLVVLNALRLRQPGAI